MADRSFDVHKGYTDAQAKYDYYILGITVALFGYLVGEFVPQAIALSGNTIELCALVCFVVSIIASIRKLEYDISCQRLNFQKLDMEEKRTITGQGIMSNQDVLNVDTGKMMSNEYLRELSEMQSNKIDVLNAVFSREAVSSGLAYSIRNGFLMSGVILLVSSKILIAILKVGA
jgi:hypothetical protein